MRPAGGAHPAVCVGPNAPVSWRGHSYFGWDVKPRSWFFVVIQNPRMSFEKSKGVTSASWPNLVIGLWSSWPPNNPHIYWLASSLCLLSTNKLVCGGRSGTIWLPSHHPGGCCTLVLDEEIPPDNVERFECLEKAEKNYINVMNYYYYYYYISHFYGAYHIFYSLTVPVLIYFRCIKIVAKIFFNNSPLVFQE